MNVTNISNLGLSSVLKMFTVGKYSLNNERVKFTNTFSWATSSTKIILEKVLLKSNLKGLIRTKIGHSKFTQDFELNRFREFWN